MLRVLHRAFLPVLLASLTVAPVAWAFHATLVKAAPAIDGTVCAAPTELTLWFNERPDVVLSNVRLMGPDSTSILVGAPHAGTDTLALTSAVRGALTAGKYTVFYRTAGPDGHVMRGKYQFTYQP